MNPKEKKSLAYGFKTKGKSVLESIEKFTTCDIEETDFRSLYILLSYGFEMILKSVVILSCDSDYEKCLKMLQKLSHDLEEIANTLGEEELNSVGIKSVKTKEETYNNSNEKFRYYCIETTNNKTINIEDLIDIRYPNPGIRTVGRSKISEYIKVIKDPILKEIDGKIENLDK